MINKEKYKQILTEEFERIKSNAIFKDNDGSYHVLGEYRILQEEDNFKVTKSGLTVGNFEKLRCALAWCVSDKNGRHDVAHDIRYLDNKISDLEHDISVRLSVAQNPETRYKITLKLDNKIRLKKELESRLRHCINTTKYWQQRGFNYELKRTRSSISC